MSGYQDLSETERARVRAQFNNPETTDERRTDLLRLIQTSADEARMGRQCPRCKHFPYFAPHDKALLEGHVYSDDGMAEIGITGYCEFCFDLITAEPDEEEPTLGERLEDLGVSDGEIARVLREGSQ
jgi:hypothetical protein